MISANLSAIFYLVSGILFILALRGLSSPDTSRQGNYFGIAGMLIAIVVTFLSVGNFSNTLIYVIIFLIIGGAIGGALWGMIPAILKVRFNTNEILTSLMLVYIALLILDYLVVGPWKDPYGYSFPKTRSFGDSGRMPLLFQGLRVHFGIIISLAAVFASWFIFSKTMLGYQLKVTGFSPTASKYAGFNQNNLIYIAFIFSGAFAGIAGLGEVSGPIGLLYRDISPNYGFTAIIVAFLGRLNPIGIVFASLVIALTYLGAEDAQLFMQIPAAVGFVFQGLVLFFLLGTELLVNYKISFRSRL